jgi:hypothetical protein
MALGDRSGVRSARNSGRSTRRPGSRGRPISLRQSQKAVRSATVLKLEQLERPLPAS